MSQIRSDFLGRSRPAARAGPGWVLLVLVVAACGEPTRPGTVASNTTAPDELAATPSRLDAIRAALADETDRLWPSLGDGLSEQPLRLALRIIRDRVAADQTAEVTAAVAEAQSLVGSYVGEPVSAVDPSELDAINLLITSIDEATTADRGTPSRSELPAVIKNNRRPT